MKKLIAAIKRAPKTAATFAIVAAAVVVPATMFAWGPGRTTFTVDNPADYVTFNSITDNPNYGNELNFLTVREAGTENDFINDITVQPGKEYEVRILVHNNANANLDLEAINTKVQAVVSQETGKTSAISSYISADNAEPKEIYDDVFFNSDENFNLAYIDGSAKVYNSGYAKGGEGKPFSDSLVTSAGAMLGYETEGDGVIPGCFKYINYVYFKVKPQFAAKPDFAMEKKVSLAGQNDWKDYVGTASGKTVDYRVEYKNTGNVQQNNVVVKDNLPEDMNYVEGSSKLYNSQNTDGKTLSDGIVSEQGVNIGSHAPGANSFVVFQATVAENTKLDECGMNTLVNTATVETDHGSKSDDANVMVVKTCDVEPEEKTIEVCVLDTKQITTIKESEFDDSKHSKNLDDCKEQPVEKTIEVCVLDTKTVATIKESEFDDSKHSMNLDDCDVVPVTPEEPETPVTPEEKPEVPTELPTTGVSNSVLTLFGLGAVTAGIGYYFTSRRN